MLTRAQYQAECLGKTRHETRAAAECELKNKPRRESEMEFIEGSAA